MLINNSRIRQNTRYEDKTFNVKETSHYFFLIWQPLCMIFKLLAIEATIDKKINLSIGALRLQCQVHFCRQFYLYQPLSWACNKSKVIQFSKLSLLASFKSTGSWCLRRLLICWWCKHYWTHLHEMVIAGSALNSDPFYGQPKGHNHILFSKCDVSGKCHCLTVSLTNKH